MHDFYVDAAFGWDYADRVQLDSSDAFIEFDAGVYDFSGSLGARLLEDWRLDLGYQSFRNTPEILFGSEAELELDSDELDFLKTKSLLFTVFRDFRVGRALRPYFGVGVGLASVDLRFSEASVNGLFLQRPRRDVINDKDTAFAYQLSAGITVPVTKWLDLAADYRYLKVPNANLTEVDGSPLSFAHGEQSAWLRVRLHAPERNESRYATRQKRVRRDPSSGFYLASRAGGGFSQDSGVEDELTIDAFEPGPTAVLAVGYSFKDRLRLELEGGYRRNEVDVIELGPEIGEDAASGDVVVLSLMANAYYVFRPNSLMRPYAGFGVGAVRSDFDIEGFGFVENFVSGPERREVFLDDTDTRAAFQVMAGVEVTLTDHLKFTADYRYLKSAQMSARRPDGDIFRGNVRNTSVIMGLQYRY